MFLRDPALPPSHAYRTICTTVFDNHLTPNEPVYVLRGMGGTVGLEKI